MAQLTEAACLLQSGAAYPRRIGLRTATGRDLLAGVKPGGVSVYYGDDPIYHFDFDGRWQRAFVSGMHYLKGLDAKVRSIAREREDRGMVLRRETLPFGRAVDLDDSIRSVALGLIDDLDSGRLEVLQPPATARPFDPGDMRSFLERVLDWDAAAWFAHRERYLATYGPIAFLPPDCPNALILQATLGDSEGRAFGRSRPAEHYVRTLGEFDEHARAVSRLIGRRVAQPRGIFLGGADVLHLPLIEILGHLDTIARTFPIGKRAASSDAWDDCGANLGTVHAFLDDFRSPLPDLEGWRRLRAANLGRVTLGVESGDLEVRSNFGKTWREDALRATVGDLKGAGIGVGMVVLVGAGGRASADQHVESTARLIGSLPLDARDLVSMVDARSLDQSRSGDLEPLSDVETAAQAKALKARASKGPKVVAYNPDKQWT